ncbi:MAG: hypothetical protein H6621_10935 [Halobacteriovoraceae bacterium]|nr:hypothetical protein [Halobacteriovoraceae bacterium]MCB9095572.1 hypothetical protein [Halobacteriovoraceae bacterium]
MFKQSFFILVLITFFTSCSLLKSARDSVVGKPTKEEYVPREEYDKLLMKYESLNKRLSEVKDDPYIKRNSEVHEMLSDMNKVQNESGEFETVASSNEEKSIVIDDGEKSSAPAEPMIKNPSGDISDLKVGLSQYKTDNYDSALESFSALENSSFDQIKVRAIFYKGLILYKQKKFDEALGHFEKIIADMDYSSIALNALYYAGLTAKKLNMNDKVASFDALRNEKFSGLTPKLIE